MLSLCNQREFIQKKRRLSTSVGAALCFVFIFSACIPKRSSGGSGSNSSSNSSESSSPLFTVISIKVGNGNNPSTDTNGIYYSQYDPLSISGACRGGVATVKVQITPQSQATTTENVNCTSTLYSWSKSLTTQTTYTIVLTPLDATATAMSNLLPISKQYVYDITDPAQPTFLTPTTTSSYTVNNGQSSFTVTGQVLNEVSELLAPGPTVLALTANADGIHQDFSYSLTVPPGTTNSATFIAFDKARNTSTSTMTITSVLGPMIPIAKADSGSSYNAGGVIIHSNIGFDHGVSVNLTEKYISGSAGIVGNAP